MKTVEPLFSQRLTPSTAIWPPSLIACASWRSTHAFSGSSSSIRLFRL